MMVLLPLRAVGYMTSSFIYFTALPSSFLLLCLYFKRNRASSDVCAAQAPLTPSCFLARKRSQEHHVCGCETLEKGNKNFEGRGKLSLRARVYEPSFYLHYFCYRIEDGWFFVFPKELVETLWRIAAVCIVAYHSPRFFF